MMLLSLIAATARSESASGCAGRSHEVIACASAVAASTPNTVSARHDLEKRLLVFKACPILLRFLTVLKNEPLTWGPGPAKNIDAVAFAKPHLYLQKR